MQTIPGNAGESGGPGAFCATARNCRSLITDIERQVEMDRTGDFRHVVFRTLLPKKSE